jgi:hypothetical protein
VELSDVDEDVVDIDDEDEVERCDDLAEDLAEGLADDRWLRGLSTSLKPIGDSSFLNITGSSFDAGGL